VGAPAVSGPSALDRLLASRPEERLRPARDIYFIQLNQSIDHTHTWSNHSLASY
jgi:hypothetical protein